MAPPKTANLSYEKTAGPPLATSASSAQAPATAKALAAGTVTGEPDTGAESDLTRKTPSVSALLNGDGPLSTSSTILALLVSGKHPLLTSTQARLIDLIRLAGPDGVISSEVPKRYEQNYGEKLDLDALSAAIGTGEKIKIKDLVLPQPGVMYSQQKGQPRYAFDEKQADVDRTLIKQQEQQLQEKIAAMTARGPSTAVHAPALPAERGPSPVDKPASLVAAGGPPHSTPSNETPHIVPVVPSTRRRPGNITGLFEPGNVPNATGIKAIAPADTSSNKTRSPALLGLQHSDGFSSSEQQGSGQDTSGGVDLSALLRAPGSVSGRSSPHIASPSFNYTEHAFSNLLSGLALSEGRDGIMPSFGECADPLDGLSDHNLPSFRGVASKRTSPLTLEGTATIPSTRRRGPDIPIGAPPPGFQSLHMQVALDDALPALEDSLHFDANDSYDIAVHANPYEQDLAREALADAQANISALQEELYARDREVTAARLEIEFLNLQLSESRVVNADAEAAKEAVIQEWRTLSQELIIQQKLGAEKDAELAVRRSSTREVDAENRKLQQENAAANTELAVLRKKIASLEPELDITKRKVASLQADNKRLDLRRQEEEKAKAAEAKSAKRTVEELARIKVQLQMAEKETLAEKARADESKRAEDTYATKVAALTDELVEAKELANRLTRENKNVVTKLHALQKMLAHAEIVAPGPRAATAEVTGLSIENRLNTACSDSVKREPLQFEYAPQAAARQMPSAPLENTEMLVPEKLQTKPTLHASELVTNSIAEATNSAAHRGIVAADTLITSRSQMAPSWAAEKAITQSTVVEKKGEAAPGEAGTTHATVRRQTLGDDLSVTKAKSENSLAPKGHCGLPDCNSSGIFICGGCKRVGYCGMKHQYEHWRTHRKSCIVHSSTVPVTNSSSSAVSDIARHRTLQV